MTGRRTLLGAMLIAVMIVGGGCGSAAGPANAAAPRPARPPSLATSLVTTTGTWAVAVMGGPAASHDNFWQAFTRPAGSRHWRLATPPGVASNGGLVIASPGAGSVVAAFRPSQYLSSSPIATTHNNGATWIPAILDASLADTPGALAAAPGGRLLALLTNGTAELSLTGGTTWAKLASRQSLAASAATRTCRPGPPTSATFSPAGVPLLAATCTHLGSAGIFSYTNGTWHFAGPPLPAAYARQAITVLRLTTTAGITTALLAAGTGPTARLLSARATDHTSRWSLSQPLSLHSATVTTASSGPGGSAIVLNTGHAAALTGTTNAWQALPSVPPGTATLAPGPAGSWQALAVHRTKLTIWQLRAGSWTATQALTVPIQFGSSG